MGLQKSHRRSLHAQLCCHRPFTKSNIRQFPAANMHRTNRPSPSMAPASNTPLSPTIKPFCLPRTSNLSNKLSEHSCTTPAQSIPLCSCQSMPSPPPNPKLPRILPPLLCIYSTMPPHILTQYYATLAVTWWYFTSTVTHPISLCQKRAAAPAVIIFKFPSRGSYESSQSPTNQPTMAASMPNAASCATSWPRPLRPELGHSTSTAKLLKFSVPLSSKWVTPNHQRPSKPTIPLPMASSILPLANANPAPWIYVSIVSATASVKTNFLVYWKPGHKNLGDYFTKHHPPAHHQTMRSTYLAQTAICSPNSPPSSVRGCFDSCIPHTGP
jgi:hypothetical protein